MAVRPHKTHQGWWVIDYYPQGRKGKRENITFQGTEANARRFEMELRRQNRESQAVISLFPQIAEAAPQFVASYKIDHCKSAEGRVLYNLKRLLPHFGKLQFTAVTNQAVEEYKKKRLGEGVKPTTVQKELCCLAAMCKWAAERGYCHPVRIKFFPRKLIAAPKKRIPSREETMALLAELRPAVRAILAAMYHAGLRSAEARLLTAGRVNLDAGLLIVLGKGNKERVVPIVPALAEILAEEVKGKSPGEYLWLNPRTGEPYKDLRTAIKYAARRAGVDHYAWTPHLLRHCFGVHATIAGVGIRALQDIMGHCSPTVTEIYSRLAATNLKDELAKMHATPVADQKARKPA